MKVLLYWIKLTYRILVHAGASGIGIIAIQLIRAWGGFITTTVASPSRSLALALGADDVITYDTTDFRKELQIRERLVVEVWQSLFLIYI